MKQQENNFKFINITEIGFWESFIENLDTKSFINSLYEIKQTNPSVIHSNKGGYQSPLNLNTFPQFTLLVNILHQEIFKLTKNPNLKISSMWGNISSFTNFNYVHTHPNQLSGILYLQTPPDSGRLFFSNPIDISHQIHYTPTPKNLIIFPGYIPHFVEPNLSQEDRISIAFNFK